MKTNSISDWIKENSWGLLGLVFVAGGLYFSIKANDKKLTNDDTRFDKQDDYNTNTDQKIDDIKATQNYNLGYRDGIKEERQVILFEMQLINEVKK